MRCLITLMSLLLHFPCMISADESARATAGDSAVVSTVDRVTRHFHISYPVPKTAPEAVEVRCAWSPAGKGEWRVARVSPLISDSARQLIDKELWEAGMRHGRFVERRAAGLVRTVVFNPYPDAQPEGRVDADFRIELFDAADGRDGHGEAPRPGQATRIAVRSASKDDPVVARTEGDSASDGCPCWRFGLPSGLDEDRDVGDVAKADVKPLATYVVKLTADNRDVRYIEDWSKVYQRDKVVAKAEGARKWEFRTNADPNTGETFGNALYGNFQPDVSLPPLSYPLGLKGWYALFVKSTPSVGTLVLRLTGDEQGEKVHSSKFGEEVLWQWRNLDRQQLVLKQPHTHTGYSMGHIDYVKLVPLSDELVAKLDAPYRFPSDRLFHAYWEPYSWAFVENVQEAYHHREPLVGFKKGGVDQIDIQLGRFGSKANYESAVLDQIISTTFGDPIEGNPRPTTDNVARMQHFTNMFQTELQYCRELGLKPHANFGAAAAYHDTEVEGDFTKKHREWLRGDALRYEVPEVRKHIISVFREALEIGAPGLSIDFCRYPEGIDTAETCTTFLRELKTLRDEFGKQRKEPVPLLVRFPAKNVRLWDRFDYVAWIREGLVDTLCPSNIQARHLHFDVAPYVAAVKGTNVKLLPVIDGLYWGVSFPGPFLRRVKQVYDAGVDGIYMYQADNRLLYTTPTDRRACRLVKSRAAVDDFWKRDAESRPRASKGIYLSFSETGGWKFHPYERGRIWLEGVPLGAVELLLDGKPFAKFAGPPYVVGSEEYASDKALGIGPHKLLVRAKDGDGWLERTFDIEGAP